MYKCIYTGAVEPASEAEHIFPKCIGGVRTLPVGYVADQVNGAFSKMELSFARQYPPVVISRMFSAPMGRKKHKNREKVGLMRDRNGGTEYMLGVIRNTAPRPIDQVALSLGETAGQSGALSVRIILEPDEHQSKEQQVATFWEKLKAYSGDPVCMKESNLPPRTYLLGVLDQCWYLAIPKSEDLEDVKPKLEKLVRKITAEDADTLLSKGHPTKQARQVEAGFSFTFNYIDVLRVYAKIAVNCLAAVKGYEFATAPALREIKRAILTGENIEKYVMYLEGPNPIPGSLRRFPNQVSLGERPHCTVFMQDGQGDLLAFIALFGTENPVVVKLGTFAERVGVDFYICDWEHRADYTMEEFVLKVCEYDDDGRTGPGGLALNNPD